MTTRRRLITTTLAGGLLMAQHLSRAQVAERIWRVGVLRPTAAPIAATELVAEGISAALRELGYVEGRNLRIESRWAQGLAERLPALADELVQAKVDVIIAVGAAALGTELLVTEVQGSDYGRAFTAIVTQRPGALFVGAHTSFTRDRQQIIALAAKHRMPAMYEWREQVEDGGLMAYGASLYGLYQRIAIYADRIFKGAKPAEMALERPTKFELVINLKTATALGLTIPQAVLLRADEVIR